MLRSLLIIAALTIALSVSAQLKTVTKTGSPSVSIEKPKSISKTVDSPLLSAISYDNLGRISAQTINRPIVVKQVDVNKMPTLISGSLINYSQDIRRQASEYLQKIGPFFQVANPGSEWEITELVTDEIGMDHIRINQVFKGVPIFNGELTMHAKKGRIETVMGRGFPTPDLETISPAINEVEAQRLVWEHLKSLDHFVEVPASQRKLLGLEQVELSLVIYHENGRASQERLAYHVKAYENLASLKTYFLDAHTGVILHEHYNICKFHGGDLPPDGPTTATAEDLNGQVKTLNVYEVGGNFFMIDATKPNFSFSQSSMPNEPKGAIWTLDAQNSSPQSDEFTTFHVANNDNVSWIDRSSVSAHYNAGVAYDYFKNTHNRNAIDGSGGNIISIVNVTDEDDNDMDNAFWNGIGMFYGNGNQAFKPLAGAVDVAGHEMSHGVIQSTSNLNYEGESGALNESFADIFGAMMDREDYQIGEDVVTNVFPSGALRDLSNPNNGGTQLGQPGYQPANVSEQYFGDEDNGGVHINSGIPNFAFFKFAEAVGKDKAETVFYRALVFYLTRSSQFIDARNAVIQATDDLYGSSEVNAARSAFDQVGIGEGAGGDYTNDATPNTGDAYVIHADEGVSKLVLRNANLEAILDPASASAPISKPSVTDDGSLIYYVNEDNQIAVTIIDWDTGNVNVEIVQDQQIWSNVVISKDGNRMAMVESAESNRIQVYDFNKQEFYTDQFGEFGFELYNPTFTAGISTGDAKFADALEFDISGEILMYDVYSELEGSFGETIGFWDIGFLRVFNNSKADWGDGNISKMFSSLSEGISIGNPTFARNSPYIIAFDYIEGDEYSLLGANVETGEVELIFENTGLSYPSYTADDDQIYVTSDGFFSTDVFKIDLQTSKITPITNSEALVIDNARWAVPFKNGTRILSNVDDIKNSKDNLKIFPNPATEFTTFEISLEKGVSAQFELRDMKGQLVLSKQVNLQSGFNRQKIDIEGLPTGSYNVILKSDVFSKVAIMVKN
jgi:Zn-dependent metalloprotease